MNDLIDGLDFQSFMKGFICNPFGEVDVEDELKGFILNLLKIVETGDGSGVEGDAWVSDAWKDIGFDKEGFGWN